MICSPKDVHVRIPRICEYVTLHNKRDFAYVIKLRILRWKCYPGLPGGPNIIRRLFIREAEKWKSEETDGAMEAEGQSLREIWRARLLALRKDEGASSQGMWAATRSWKRWGNRFSAGASGVSLSLSTPWFQPSETISESGLQSCKIIRVVCFKPWSLW